MVTLSMTNRNPSSSYKKITIHIPSGICFSEDEQVIGERASLTALGFEHPLLSEASNPIEGDVHVYEYDDFIGLMLAAKFIYGVLIRVNNPMACQFIIRPSVQFQRLKAQYTIPFSFNYKKSAQKSIPLEQFNAIISGFKKYAFQYQDGLVLDKTITINELPDKMDADSLYETHADIEAFCKQVEQVSQYDIRYINKAMGFGVFARQCIQKDSMIALYCGIKTVKEPGRIAYVFNEKNDGLKLDIDARQYGNFSRFINHAESNSDSNQDKKICAANVKALSYQMHGNNVIVYIAAKDILPGEQLLVDYGSGYFKKRTDMIVWHRNGDMLDATGKKMIVSSFGKKRELLKEISQEENKRSLVVLKRPFMVFFLSILLMVGLRFLEYSR